MAGLNTPQLYDIGSGNEEIRVSMGSNLWSLRPTGPQTTTLADGTTVLTDEYGNIIE